MMRNYLAIGIVFTLCLICPGQSHLDLGRLYREFFDVAHGKDVIDLLEQKMQEHDPDMMRIARFVNSSSFKSIHDHMWTSYDVRELYYWLLQNGLHIDLFFDWLYDLLNWGEFVPPPPPSKSLKSLFSEVKAIIPIEDVLKWGIMELVLGKDMVGLFNKLQEDTSHAAWDHMYKSMDFLETRCLLIQEGFAIEINEELLCSFLDWKECKKYACPRKSDATNRT